MEAIGPRKFLRSQVDYNKLLFYQKADALYQMTVVFCRRFLPRSGDRTVDQMVQAARSGKQNVAEACADGVVSLESALKLMNVARGSLVELREDYRDFLNARKLLLWTWEYPGFNAMMKECRTKNRYVEFEPFLERWSPEQFANYAITLCRITEKMMTSYLQAMERDFLQNGGIRERMASARLNVRQSQTQEIYALKQKIERLEEELNQLRKSRNLEI
ncbi:MAG: four helix bundle suffix domain-containing protein [Oligosphaeraceae bacterium]